MDNIENIVKTTLSNFDGLIEGKNVLGSPVLLEDGTLLVPVRKISIGFFSGGGEYGAKVKQRGDDAPYAGGGGGGVSIVPLGFVTKKGDVTKYIRVDEEEDKWMTALKTVVGSFKKPQ